MAHPEAEWLSQQNILVFVFSYFTIFYFHLRTQFWKNRTVARKSPEMFVQGFRHSENLNLIHNTAFANCAN